MKKAIIILVASAVFAGCSKDDGKDDKANSGYSISGTIVGDWDKVGLSFDYGETWAVTAPVSKGSFRLTFPEPDKKYLQLQDGVYGSEAALYASNSMQITYLLGEGNSSRGIVYVNAFVYVSKDTYINDSEGSEVWDMELKRGWNPLVVYFSDGIYTYTCDIIPAGVVWSAASGW